MSNPMSPIPIFPCDELFVIIQFASEDNAIGRDKTQIGIILFVNSD